LMISCFQCPNPDFNKEQNRWRMVRRMLVEAVADLLQPNGKVYALSITFPAETMRFCNETASGIEPDV
jgi:hypothetical protein